MEVEYELKTARPAQDLSFDSVETESAFVLLVHLPGEERKGIKIEVSEDGKELSISGGGGGGSTREHVLARRVRLRREEEVGRFLKAFRVPEGVDTEGIEAEYDENDEILVVHLPKLVGGAAAGARIEEIKEEERVEEAKGIPPREEPEVTHRDEETLVPVEMPGGAPASPEPMAIPIEGEGRDGGTGTSGRRRRGTFMLAGSALFILVVALAFHVLRRRSKRTTR